MHFNNLLKPWKITCDLNSDEMMIKKKQFRQMIMMTINAVNDEDDDEKLMMKILLRMMMMIENLLRPNMKIMIENLLRPMRTKAFSSLVSAASVGETSWMKNLAFVHFSFFVVMMIKIKIKIIQIIIMS